MKRVFSGFLAVSLVMVLLLTYSGTALAGHTAARGETDSRINVLANCDGAVTYPVDTTFYVEHGFLQFGWSTLSDADQRAFNAKGTTFELYIDGELQKSHEFASYDDSTDIKYKLFTTEIHGGLPAGDYTFTGEWYESGAYTDGKLNSAVFLFSCDLEVTMDG